MNVLDCSHIKNNKIYEKKLRHNIDKCQCHHIIMCLAIEIQNINFIKEYVEKHTWVPDSKAAAKE